MMLSKRSDLSRDYEDFSLKILQICDSNPFDEKNNNTDGYINMGTSMNKLSHYTLKQKLKECWQELDIQKLKYESSYLKLRKAMANMMSIFLESYESLSPDNLFCFSGVSSCIDLMAHCLADPGEAFLVPTPVCSGLYSNFMQRSLVEILPISILTGESGLGSESEELTMEKIKFAYENAHTLNKVVRGMFLINPNDLGDVYSPELLKDALTFCNENSLHFIVVECHALSTFSQWNSFYSILKFQQLPDTERTHVLFGLSEAFGLEGFRIGFIHTKCKELQKYLTKVSHLQTLAPSVMTSMAILLEDLEWCNDYVKEIQASLAERHRFCVFVLKDKGVKVRECPTGHYLWLDLREFCGQTFHGEKQLFDFFLNEHHLYLGPGEQFFCEEPGWFRMTITQKGTYLTAGLRRLIKALDEKEEIKLRKSMYFQCMYFKRELCF